MAGAAHLHSHAIARERSARRNAAHLQHGHRHVARRPGKEVQESRDGVRPRGGEVLRRGTNSEGGAKSKLQLKATSPTIVQELGTRCRRCQFPPFANCTKDGAPLCVGNTGEIKSPGHPPKVNMADEDLRARFPEAVFKLNDDELGVVARFGRIVSFKNGETVIQAGTRSLGLRHYGVSLLSHSISIRSGRPPYFGGAIGSKCVRSS